MVARPVKTLFNHKDRSEFILDLANKGIASPYIHYPQPFFNECAIRNDMSISFDPEGYAYKCWKVFGNKEYAIGKLNKDGKLANVNEIVLNCQLFEADLWTIKHAENVHIFLFVMAVV